MQFLALLCMFAALLALPAHASQYKRIHYSTGTGFFLSPYGDLITNAHVINDCKPGTIILRGAIESPAKLVATDSQHDLALLRAERGIPASAKLAETDRSIHKGDTAMVIGYPKNRKREDDYKVVYASIIDVQGPQGEEEWVQFSDAAQQGNSGGPLLDESGNVIGVVTGKTELFRIDRKTRTRELVSKSDVAVALPVLKRFLRQNKIRYQSAGSHVRRAPSYVENRAGGFIAHVKCITGEEIIR